MIIEFVNVSTRLFFMMQIEGELDVDSVECRRLFLLRSHLMSALLGNEKSREREDALSKMTQRFVNLSESWASGSAVHLVLPVMILIITATKNTGVILLVICLFHFFVVSSEISDYCCYFDCTVQYPDSKVLCHLMARAIGISKITDTFSTKFDYYVKHFFRRVIKAIWPIFV